MREKTRFLRLLMDRISEIEIQILSVFVPFSVYVSIFGIFLFSVFLSKSDAQDVCRVKDKKT